MIQELQIQCGLQDFNKSYYKVSSCSSPLVKQKAPANLTKKSARYIFNALSKGRIIYILPSS